MKTTTGRLIRRGIFTENPLLVQLLGLTPALAVTTSVVNAVGMGAVITAVLCASCLIISLLRPLIPCRIRVMSLLAVAAAFTTAAELILEAYFPALGASLGIFVSLVAVSSVILSKAEGPASRLSPVHTIADSIATGIGFTGALVAIGALRELVGTGRILAAPDGTGGFTLFGSSYPGAAIMLMPAGALILLGLAAALVQGIKGTPVGETQEDEALAEEPVEVNVHKEDAPADEDTDSAPADTDESTEEETEND